MVNLTKLYCGEVQPADALRYGQGHGASRAASDRKPIVVWNITRRCNLKCLHCYSDSDYREYPGELNWDQCVSVVDDLAAYGVPAVLLSGGEPLIHPRFFELAGYARSKGLRLTLSTNGALIDASAACRIKELGFSYVGISLDGIGATHDFFRGRTGAFTKAVAAFRFCKAVGQKVGLRLTLSRHNIDDLDGILDFIEREDVDRACFYHLVHSGRGHNLVDVTHEDSRSALDKILDRTSAWAATGRPREILTVDQPADGPYLYLRLKEQDAERAAAALELMKWNGGGLHSSGTGIGNIDTQGNVHPDQFWQSLTLGNVKERPFSEIWRDPGNETLAALRQRAGHLEGRCAQCRFLPVCGGGFRVRAVQVTGRLWAPDPACYLTDEEIAPDDDDDHRHHDSKRRCRGGCVGSACCNSKN